ADAEVLWCGKKDGYGYTVDVLFADGRKMRFSSLHKYKVKKGQKLKAGDVIGLVGKSASNATGPHVHVEVYKDGEHIDPQKVKGLKLY
ncbi:MAG: M23 family metallopeptidase, partial [Pseudomonadota bacterium]